MTQDTDTVSKNMAKKHLLVRNNDGTVLPGGMMLAQHIEAGRARGVAEALPTLKRYRCWETRQSNGHGFKGQHDELFDGLLARLASHKGVERVLPTLKSSRYWKDTAAVLLVV